MKPIWIELVNKGVANRFEFEDYELIEMNWRLTMYPKLYQEVYQHELSHNDGDYTTKDFSHDMKSRTPGLFKFMRNHISSWTQVLPFYYDLRKNKLVYDISSIVSWIFIAAVATGIYLVLGWMP